MIVTRVTRLPSGVGYLEWLLYQIWFRRNCLLLHAFDSRHFQVVSKHHSLHHL